MYKEIELKPTQIDAITKYYASELLADKFTGFLIQWI